jgi:hypothetical protein
MYEVLRTKNDNKTIVADLGIMTREELIEFGERYIGEDTTKYPNVFRNKKELLDDIDFIDKNGDEMWYEWEDTNINIKLLENKGE